MTSLRFLASAIVLAAVSAPSTGLAQWQAHEVRQLNGQAGQRRLPARFQIVTESWNRVVAVPYMVNSRFFSGMLTM